jgi:hypothetical protein
VNVTLALVVAAAGAARAQSATPRLITLPAPDATVPAEFTRATSVRELSDGRLLIVDWSDQKVFVAGRSNAEVQQLGRNGSGPGEYLQPGTLFALGGDSTLLADSRNGRWLLLHGATIAATVGPDAPVIMSGARTPLGADDQGHVIFTTGIGGGVGTSPIPSRRDSVLLARAARATGQVDTVVALRSRPATITVEGPADKPTSVSVRVNPLATGELAALFSDGWIAIARLDPYRVDWMAPDGTRINGTPLPFTRVRLDEREQRAFLDRRAARTGTTPPDPATLPEWPEYVPPFLSESLLRAPDGRLWIRRTPTAANPHPPYDVVDRRGALVARVAVGKAVEVIGFGQAAVYTAATDDTGIQHVQRRPLPKL